MAAAAEPAGRARLASIGVLVARIVASAAGARPAAPARRIARLLAAASLSGGMLLALEVVWFRLLELFVFETPLAFALMLAVVLAGIGVGGLAPPRGWATAAVRRAMLGRCGPPGRRRDGGDLCLSCRRGRHGLRRYATRRCRWPPC